MHVGVNESAEVVALYYLIIVSTLVLNGEHSVLRNQMPEAE
jgi:hypothetical protein